MESYISAHIYPVFFVHAVFNAFTSLGDNSIVLQEEPHRSVSTKEVIHETVRASQTVDAKQCVHLI